MHDPPSPQKTQIQGVFRGGGRRVAPTPPWIFRILRERALCLNLNLVNNKKYRIFTLLHGNVPYS